MPAISYQEVITVELGKPGGRRTIQGLRIVVGDVLRSLTAGMNPKKILANFLIFLLGIGSGPTYLLANNISEAEHSIQLVGRAVFVDIDDCITEVDNDLRSGAGNVLRPLPTENSYSACSINVNDSCFRHANGQPIDCNSTSLYAWRLAVTDAFNRLLVLSLNSTNILGRPESFSNDIVDGHLSYLSDSEYDCKMQSLLYPNSSNRYFYNLCLQSRAYNQTLLYRTHLIALQLESRRACLSDNINGENQCNIGSYDDLK